MAKQTVPNTLGKVGTKMTAEQVAAANRANNERLALEKPPVPPVIDRQAESDWLAKRGIDSLSTPAEKAAAIRGFYKPDQIKTLGLEKTLAELDAQSQPFSVTGAKAMGLNEEQIGSLAAYGRDYNVAKADYRATPKPTNSALGVLQEALNAKSNVYNQPLGQSELFAQAGIPTTGVSGYAALAQSLAQRSQEMQNKYNNYANLVDKVGTQMSDTFNARLSAYKLAKDDYDQQLNIILAINKDALDQEQAIKLIERKSELDKEMEEWKITHKTTELPTAALKEWAYLGGEAGTGMSAKEWVLKESSTGLNPQQAATFNSIVSKYNNSPLVQANDKAPILKKTAEALRKNPKDSALQTSFIYAMIKALDTYDSAVREGEIGLLKDTQGMAEKIRNLPDEILKGSVLDEAAINRYLNVAELLTSTISEGADKKLKDFQAQADANGDRVGSAFNSYAQNVTGKMIRFDSPKSAVENYIKENPWAIDVINEGFADGTFKKYQDILDSGEFEGLSESSVKQSAFLAPSRDTSNMVAATGFDNLKKLAGNCVKFTRQFVPNLPYGLWDKEDKKQAVLAVGDRDMQNIKVGDAILTGEGKWGHAAIVLAKINENLLLREANYKSGIITEGRMISQNDPLIYGFVPRKETAPENIGNDESKKKEGTNPSIEDLLFI